LLNRFQLACATAARRIRVIAEGLTGGSCVVRPLRACRTEPSRFLSREVLAAAAGGGSWRRSVQSALP